MSSFISLVLYAGVAVLVVLGALVAVVAVIGIIVTFSPTLIPGFLQN